MIHQIFTWGVAAAGVLLCASFATLVAAAEPRFELVDGPPTDTAHAHPVIPWVLEGDTTWRNAKPLFDLADADTGTKATGWVAVTNKAILVHVVVLDKSHINNRTDGSIWDGDAIQLGIDARGDGVGSLPKGFALTGPGDASLAFALTDQGSKAYAYFHGRPGGVGAAPQLAAKITRDEATKLTTYEITLPWAEFETAPGIYPKIGLSIMVNDSDPGRSSQTRLSWGGGAGGNLRPGLFNLLVLGPPTGEVISIMPSRDALWRASDYGEVEIAIASDKHLEISGAAAGAKAKFPVPQSSVKAGIRRYALRLHPGGPLKAPIDLDAGVGELNGKQQAGLRVTLQTPKRVLDELSRRVDALLAKSPHPLFARLLRSTEAIVETEYQRASTQVVEQPKMAMDIVGYAQKILDGLNGAAADWDQYTKRRRMLTLSFVARDGSLQPYHLTLPAHWEPGKTYPLIVYLHGAGSPDTLNFVSQGFDVAPNSEAGESEPDAYAYVLLPWGRGNMGYRSAAENDVWDAMADASHAFKFDPDRTYLTGHSMGGGGTWALGLRTPDRWAAIGIYAGGSWYCPVGIGLGGNAAGLPVRILHGDSDGAAPVSGAYAMQAELRQNGVEPTLVIVPGGGHDLGPDQAMANSAWLLQHTRKRPDKFSFVADTDEHSGRNGITMARNAAVSFLPKFECQIEGNTVHLTTVGTNWIKVELRSDGLGLTGPVTFFWNGKKVYTGDANQIYLDVDKGVTTT